MSQYDPPDDALRAAVLPDIVERVKARLARGERFTWPTPPRPLRYQRPEPPPPLLSELHYEPASEPITTRVKQDTIVGRVRAAIANGVRDVYLIMEMTGCEDRSTVYCELRRHRLANEKESE